MPVAAALVVVVVVVFVVIVVAVVVVLVAEEPKERLSWVLFSKRETEEGKYPTEMERVRRLGGMERKK